MRWLLPRFPRFQRDHPEVQIRFDTTAASVDLASRQLDLGIRFGFGQWPGLIAERLFSYDWVPVCAPSLLADGQGLERPADLRHVVRLHVAIRPDDWRMWLLAAGVEGIDPDAGPVFESMPIALEAAIQGMGVVVAERHLVRDDVAAGKLVTLFDEIHVPSSGAFYLVYPEGGLRDARIKAFRDWLFKERRLSESPGR
jgi:LysR family glycine cleavage system transcriptional activator